MAFSIYVLIGIFAGLLSGLLGIGGGIIVVPALLLWFQHMHLFPDNMVMHIATGTSLAAIICTSSSSALTYHQRGFVVRSVFLKFFPGLCLGMVLGTSINNHVSSNTLSRLFAVFLLLVTMYLFLPQRHSSNHYLKPSSVLALIILVSCVIGILSTLLGIGGGLLIVPFFLFLRFSMNEASGTAALCGVPISILGTLMLSVSGWTDTSQHMPWGTVGYIYWPAALMISLSSILCANIAARYAITTKAKTRKLILSVILMICSINMLIFH